MAWYSSCTGKLACESREVLQLPETAAEDFFILAARALEESEPAAAETQFEELVKAVARVFGDNQKDIAQELARLARRIEEGGRTDDAMRLKQRTCEVMLKMSMAARQRRSPQPLPEPSPPPVPRDELAFLLCSDLPDLSALLSVKSGNGWVQTTGGTLLVSHSGRVHGFVPVFVTERMPGDCKRIQVLGAEVCLVQLADGTRLGFLTRDARAKLNLT